jgi:hypothetical protein
VSEEKSKPILDEQTLDRLLEAAYVLQEHNRERREIEQNQERKRVLIEAERLAVAASNEQLSPPVSQKSAAQADYTVTLGKIVETQRQIQVRQLDLESAMSLVTERAVDISGASGAAIGMVEGASLHYRAVSGQTTPSAASIVPARNNSLRSCIKTGQVLRCSDISETAIDKEEFRGRGIKSLIAAPVFLHGDVAGTLELYYSEAGALPEQDVHTCQLMAGLVTEALVREEETTWKKSLASERAAMLEALEKLQPNLAALIDKTDNRAEASAASPTNSIATSPCARCGHELLADEQFCGECGFSRNGEHAPTTTGADAALIPEMPAEKAEADIPGTDAPGAIPQVQLDLDLAQLMAAPEISAEQVLDTHTAAETPSPEEIADFAELLQSVEEGSSPVESASPEESTSAEPSTTPEEDESAKTTAIQKLNRPTDWSSAAAAKDFLERLVADKRSGSIAQFWSTRRGDIYLAIAVVLVICVIFWGMMSNHPVGANASQNPAAAEQQKAPSAGISLWDRMLIQLGLADAPEPPEDKGNPATQVWIDQRTGQYYCPGADLYGKTPKGKFASQRDAQLDQFEPAFRKPCN